MTSLPETIEKAKRLDAPTERPRAMITNLIEKLEAATEGSAVLDWEIAEFFPYADRRPGGNWYAVAKHPDGRIWPVDASFEINESRMIQSWTRSLDAALTLVPEDKQWGIEWWADKQMGAAAWVQPPFGSSSIYASTPALALCIAALRVRDIELLAE